MTSQIVIVSTVSRYMQRVTDALDAAPFVVQHEVRAVPDPAAAAAAWQRLLVKFRARYPTLDRDRHHLHRQRAAGLPGVRLIVFMPTGAEYPCGWTLVSNMPLADGERWRDARRRDQRATYGWFEAVRRTRPGSSSPGWTWQLTDRHYELAREGLVRAIRRGDRRWVELAAREARRWPGFGPIRRQHRALGLLLEREAKRRGFANPPAWPRIGYVRRLPSR